MKRRAGTNCSEEQKALIWDRRQQGESLHASARLFDRHHPSIRGILAETGGIRTAAKVRAVTKPTPGALIKR